MISETGYAKAIELLRQASTVSGFVASVQEHDNYKRIWTRDGVVNGMAALMSEEKDLVLTFRATLETIFEHQHPTGFMPSNVSLDGSASYGGTVGRADNPSWAVIGLCQYSLISNDPSLAGRYELQVTRCFAVMDAWEFNGKHLLYVPQSGDWADEYIQHGYILFDQLLRVWALRLAALVFNHAGWDLKANMILDVIRRNFWNTPGATSLYAPNLNHQRATAPTEYWFLGFNPARIYNHFDLQANSLALLLGIDNDVQEKSLLAFIKRLIASSGAIVPSFYPAIESTDWEMKELESNYAYSFRNKPHEFHNGGLWPVWNGFLVAALMQKNEPGLAEQVVKFIHEANSKNQWEMNECFHGQLHNNIGVPRCTWSAGGAVIAERSVSGSKLYFVKN